MRSRAQGMGRSAALLVFFLSLAHEVEARVTDNVSWYASSWTTVLPAFALRVAYAAAAVATCPYVLYSGGDYALDLRRRTEDLLWPRHTGQALTTVEIATRKKRRSDADS